MENSTEYCTVRMKLKIFRISRNMSQAQFAETLGYSRGHYARIENGQMEVTMNFLNALVEAFGITFDKAQALVTKEQERSS